MNKFYINRPRTLEDKERILDFLELEKQCDEHNAEQLEVILSFGQTNKTKTKDTEAAIKRWSKDYIRNNKHYSKVEPHFLGRTTEYIG